jgi:hypothetical protein
MKKNFGLALAIGLTGICGTAAASSDADRIDFNYPSNASATGACTVCWAYDYATNGAATRTSDTVQFHIQGNDHERSEFRMPDRTNATVFTGTMRVDAWSDGTNGVTVMQTFGKEQKKPVAQLIIDGGGQFRIEQGGGACGVRAFVGKRYNIRAEYAPNGTVRTWVGNSECPQKKSISNTNYTKVGAYFTNSGSGNTSVTWENFFVGNK